MKISYMNIGVLTFFRKGEAESWQGDLPSSHSSRIIWWFYGSWETEIWIWHFEEFCCEKLKEIGGKLLEIKSILYILVNNIIEFKDHVTVIHDILVCWHQKKNMLVWNL